MIDREKIIKALECCTQYGCMCGLDCNGHWGWADDSHTDMELLNEYRTKCPYGNCETGCVKTLAMDALALLKAQEPVEPIQGRDDQDEDIFCCGVCGAVVGETYLGPPGECEVRDNYCPECGRAVKWVV